MKEGVAGDKNDDGEKTRALKEPDKTHTHTKSKRVRAKHKTERK